MQICLINKILAMIKDEIFSVNSDFSEFDLQQLEERLETDPLVTGGLLDLVDDPAQLVGLNVLICRFVNYNAKTEVLKSI